MKPLHVSVRARDPISSANFFRKRTTDASQEAAFMLCTDAMDHLTDQELIRAHKQGDARAFDELVRRHLTPVYRFLLRMLRHTQEAEDVTQETFVKAWKKISTYDASASFKTWLFAIARNTAIDHIRKRIPLPFSALDDPTDEDGERGSDIEAIADTQPLADEVLQRADLAEELSAALDQLPPNARSVVLLHDTEDLTFQEIADTVHEPMNTVKSRYRRATQLLKTILTKRPL